jgi:hypothetical protein
MEPQDHGRQLVILGIEIGHGHVEHLRQPFKRLQIRLVDAGLVSVYPRTRYEIVQAGFYTQVPLRQTSELADFPQAAAEHR